MKKIRLRNLLLLVTSLILVEFIPFYKNKAKSQYLRKNIFEELDITDQISKLNNFDEQYKFSNLNSSSKGDFRKVLNTINNKLSNFLVFESQDINKEKFEVNIISDTQYQENQKLYAEGNAEVYFSNATLKGDLITYDKIEKILTVDGNVFFKKGDHIIEGSKFEFNSITGKGSFSDAYGLLDLKSFNQDFDLNAFDSSKKKDSLNDPNINDIEYIDSTSVGFTNKFEPGKKFNISDLQFTIPEIKKWRFKTKKLLIENSIIKSDEIFFTSDPLNKPQFILQSKNFTGEIINDKTKIISRSTWIILDNKIKIPIGKRRIFDDDPISKWGIGTDYKDKDGFYISRSFRNIDISNNFQLKLQPYYLIQRSIQGTTKSFRAKNRSILSNKETRNIVFGDNFGLDASLKGELYSWDLDLKTSLNSLDPNKFSEAFRSKLNLIKTINLSPSLENKNDSFDSGISELKKFENYFDFKISNSFREKIDKGFSGEEEIYFGNSFLLSNRKYWKNNENTKNLNLIYGFGEYKAEKRDEKKLTTLSRNFIGATFNNRFPLWKNKAIDEQINYQYKFSPTVIKQGLYWNNEIKTGIFVYSNDSSQSALTLNTGPELILGSFKKNFLDYSKISLIGTYIFKDGQSPFAFDDIDKTKRLRINLEQQLIGPLLLSYDTYLNLDSDNKDYGKFSKHKYGLDIKRRAYSIGAFYDTSNNSAGINFKIYNFDYARLSPKF